ncbi:MAG: 3-hydroxyacyl-CoA dehydrogenase/enoyl-CoA hydratase family protein [SAR324 cluster bacterium]|nr:3-hydroxyacyl-CoA dehydrogenase/enoyl-CoA hydratase family protein [SAR324 cluster bacterium]
MKSIEKAAVLGAGVMGATIAAHLANAGVEVLLLDILPKDAPELGAKDAHNRSSIAANGLKALAKLKPAPFYLKDYASRISVGNLTDDLEKLKTCDWIVEVVIERMDIKLSLLEKLAPNINKDAILSTNTSGLSVTEMSKALPDDLKKRFLVTHFFNPPRYMRLMEIVPTPDTDPAIVEFMADFTSNRLGKGVVFAKDTPNFVANRIGVYSIYKGMEHMAKMGLTVEEVDAISGPATARPKSAAFRTSDLVGLDTMVHVANNSYENLPNDEEREVFKVPEYLTKMVENGQLGNKSGSGFYKKGRDAQGNRTITYFDYVSGEYKDLEKPRFKSIGNARMEDNPRKRLKKLFEIDDKASQFAWAALRDILLYTFRRIPEIADDIVNIDNGMRWGFNWDLGPFEMFDALGVKWFCEKAKAEGVTLPEGLEKIESFYRFNDGVKEYYDILAGKYVPIKLGEKEINLEIIKKAGGVVDQTGNCSLVDLGDGVFGFEFHSKMNSISGDILGKAIQAVRYAEKEGVGLVIGNQGVNFTVGANLALLTMAIAEGDWDDIGMMIRQFQNATMAMKLAKVPVVVAPFHMTLGGGCEFSLHGAAINAYSETYMGLVEIGVGLLPAGGGTKEMCLRAVAQAAQFGTDPTPYIFKYFQQIGMATVSMGADELFDMGYMRHGDSVTFNLANLIGDAKKKVLGLATNFRPQHKQMAIPAPGRSIAASIQSSLWNMAQGGFATEYEFELGKSIAHVITGGDVPAGTLISEDYLLDLELEGFLRLCGNKKTYERIQHTLKTGKPLRN